MAHIELRAALLSYESFLHVLLCRLFKDADGESILHPHAAHHLLVLRRRVETLTGLDHMLLLNEAIDVAVLLAYLEGLLLVLLRLARLGIGQLFLKLACIVAAMVTLGSPIRVHADTTLVCPLVGRLNLDLLVHGLGLRLSDVKCFTSLAQVDRIGFPHELLLLVQSVVSHGH